ncbi:hypothetical protein ACF0H5_008948 [Mactra antiquata]
MAKVPGSAGLPLLGDRSYDFYKDPIKFQLKHLEQTKSRIFLSRFLNMPTVFVGSNKALKEILTDNSDKLNLGYKQFMGEIYGSNILFTDGDYAQGLRSTLKHLFTPDSVTSYKDTIERIVKKSVASIDSGASLCAYQHFKKLSIEICLSLFLGLNFNDLEADIITELTTTHWHGIISVPVALKIPKMSESSYSKALDAKRKLLDIIQKRRDEKCHSFPQKVETLPDLEEVLVNNHLLLFTSALVPKALSSILTSFLIEVGEKGKEDLQDSILNDDEMFECILLEILRVYPPFLGGRRIITQDFMLDGYKLSSGHAMLYLTYLAHRDPDIFDHPDEFIPLRWLNKNKNDRDKLFCFGCGPRNCLGQDLVWSILKTVIKELLCKYKLILESGQNLSYKWLPVSRPIGNVMVKFEPRHTNNDDVPT